MSRLIFRINPTTDSDIIAYLEKQPNRSDTIRQAIREHMEKEAAVNSMMAEMAKPKSALEQAKDDILYLLKIYPTTCRDLESVKRYAAGIYTTPDDKKLLEQAWEELIKDGKINP